MITKQKTMNPSLNLLEHLKNVQKIAIFKQLQPKHRDKMMRDDFIGGLSNPSIRQRLLEEEEELHFQEALTKAEVLDRAQRQSHTFFDSNPVDNEETKVFCGSTSRSLKSIRQNVISAEKSFTLKEEDFALRKTKLVLNAEKLVILGVSAKAYHLKEWRLYSHMTTTN